MRWFWGHKIAALGLVPKWFISAIDMVMRNASLMVSYGNSVRRYNKFFAPNH